QNSHPMSAGMYSASSLRASSAIRVAFMTSMPTPSPGIHAIRYLGIVPPLDLFEPLGDDVLRAAGDHELLRDGRERGERELFAVARDQRALVVHFDLRSLDRRLVRRRVLVPEILHKLGTLKHDEAVVERVALVGF